MPSNLQKIPKYIGIYYRESSRDKEGNPLRKHKGKPDRCYYVTYRNNAKKFVREKVGWASEGYTTQIAVHLRAESLRKIRHGKSIPDKKKREITVISAKCRKHR